MALAFISSCSPSKKAPTVSKPAPVAPAGITFTEVENYKDFASIQLPFEGSKFRKQESSNQNDAGEFVPTIKYGGNHVYPYGDLSRMVDVEGDKSDINAALEGLKTSIFLERVLKKESVVEQYSNVVIGGKTCKRVYVYYTFISETYSSATYTLGYIIPHHETTAIIMIDKAQSEMSDFEADSKVLDTVLKYMVETVEFREYSK